MNVDLDAVKAELARPADPAESQVERWEGYGRDFVPELVAELERVTAERDQLTYERRLLGACRRHLDEIADPEGRYTKDAIQTAADLAQRIVDEIGHSVTDEPALGPDFRDQIIQLTAERDQARAMRNDALIALHNWEQGNTETPESAELVESLRALLTAQPTPTNSQPWELAVAAAHAEAAAADEEELSEPEFGHASQESIDSVMAIADGKFRSVNVDLPLDDDLTEDATVAQQLADINRREHARKRLNAAAIAWSRDVGEVDLSWSVGVNLKAAVNDLLALDAPPAKPLSLGEIAEAAVERVSEYLDTPAVARGGDEASQ